jgi:phosphatidylserine/phosphatidylglycerophosphate/cardiolipin synthase-like enzyme
MSKIDVVRQNVQNYFNHLSGPSYVRILDTPHVWGMQSGKAIMPQALARQAEFERAIVEIIQKSRYRCDLSSLNSPDPDWVRAILGAMDTALTKKTGTTESTQFRFLFGQTPLFLLSPLTDPANYTEFKGALVRLVRTRSGFWERKPEIWMGRFYRLEEGILSALKAKIFGDTIISSDDTKMTWNHTKIIAVDGTEALVGGHNLNMDLFRSYPPVHDVSVVVHGEAAYGSQLFLNKMWECGNDLLTKEYLDVGKLSWINGDSDRTKPTDPLRATGAASYMSNCQKKLIKLHEAGVQNAIADVPISNTSNAPQDIRAQDLQTLTDLKEDVFQERIIYSQYDKFNDYKLATRILAVGKYWAGPKDTDYQKASEVMKEQLIKNATRTICMSQMDLISAWKKNWSDHVVCIWIMDALLANKNLRVYVVVSPLDAGAGVEGDQYSFGSGAGRTFDLIKYYMAHNAQTDAALDDRDGARADALKRLYIAPFYFTDLISVEQTIEGVTYKWPDLPAEGYTATLKQKPLIEKPPSKGVIGSAALSVINASGYIYDKVPSAPGNHAKIMIADDELYVVGSDNLYPGSLSEFNYLVEGEKAVKELLESYWTPLWRYSGPHANGLIPGAAPLHYGSTLNLISSEGLYVSPMIEEYSGPEATWEYFARVSTSEKVALKIEGGDGQVQPGRAIKIKTTEEAVGDYCYLGAWKSANLFYYKSGYVNLNWHIDRVDKSRTGSLVAGEAVTIKNDYYNQYLVMDGSYLTTQSEICCWFWLPAFPLPSLLSAPTQPDRLTAGQGLVAGQSITSADGRFNLTLQTDANLVLYGPGRKPSDALWSSNTYKHKGYTWYIAMQGDGNLVVYDSKGKWYWASHTVGNPGAWVRAESDGNVVIYNAKSEWIWQTGTAGGQKSLSWIKNVERGEIGTGVRRQ